MGTQTLWEILMILLMPFLAMVAISSGIIAKRMDAPTWLCITPTTILLITAVITGVCGAALLE